MIKAGGGEVMEVSPPYSNISGLTHFLTDLNNATNKQIGFQNMANQGVPVLHSVYLTKFLGAPDTAPDLENYLVEEFKPFWESRKRNGPTRAGKKSRNVL